MAENESGTGAPSGLSGALLVAWQRFERPAEPAASVPENELVAAHRALGEWPSATAALREHALRYATSHLLAAGDLKGAQKLALSADYLTAQCREIGVGGALASLQTGAERAAKEPAGKMDAKAWTSVAEAVRAETERLSRAPLALPALVFERLRAAGWDPKRISDVLHLPEGFPRIRRLHPASGNAASPATLSCGLSADGKRAVFGAEDGSLVVREVESDRVLLRTKAHKGAVFACGLVPDGSRAVSSGADGLANVWSVPVAPSAKPIVPRPFWSGQQNPTPAIPPTIAKRLAITNDGHTAHLGMAEPGSLTACVEGREIDAPKNTPPFSYWSEMARGGADDAAARSRGAGPKAPKSGPLDGLAELEALPGGEDVVAAIAHFNAIQDQVDKLRAQESAKVAEEDAAHKKLRAKRALLKPGAPAALMNEIDALTAREAEIHAQVEAIRKTIDEQTTQQNAMLEQLSRDADQAVSVFADPGQMAAAPTPPFAATSGGDPLILAKKEQLVLAGRDSVDPAHAPPGLLGSHPARVTAVAVTPDDLRAVSGAADGTLRVWDIPSRKQIGSLDGHQGPIGGLAVTSDGKRLVSTSGETLRLWDLTAMRPLEAYPAPAEVRCVAASSNRIAAGDAAGGEWMFEIVDPPPASAGQIEATGPVHRRYALLVGANAYDDKALPALPYCVNDVRDLGRVLEERSYCVTALHDEQAAAYRRPTRANIRDELSLLRLSANDMLLVHFSCHGVRLAERAYVFAADTVAARVDETGIPVDEIIARMAATGARRLVLMLDSCYSGVALPGRGGAPPTVSPSILDAMPKADDETGTQATAAQATGAHAAQAPSAPQDPAVLREAHDLAEGFALLAASSAMEMSRDRSTRPNSLFSSLVIDGLEGKADIRGRGFVSVQDLNDYVVSRGVPLAREERGVRQTPTAQVQGKGDMVLVRLG
ncbi:MAG: caspase family protein [Polyangiaceae bacterium]